MPQIESHMSLKGFVIVHFVLTVWASMGGLFPPAYIYCHAVVLLFGVWGILNAEAPTPILMFLIFNVISVPMDVIFLAIFQPFAYDRFERGYTTGLTHLYRFSLGMSIVNLILKPVTCLVSFRMYQERGGTYSSLNIPVPGLQGLGTGSRGGQYENIDQPVPTNQVETAAPHQTLEKPPPNYSQP